MTAVLISHVNITNGVVCPATPANGTIHKVGHLPSEGWFCTCRAGKWCPQVKHVKALVPVEAIEA